MRFMLGDVRDDKLLQEIEDTGSAKPKAFRRWVERVSDVLGTCNELQFSELLRQKV